MIRPFESFPDAVNIEVTSSLKRQTVLIFFDRPLTRDQLEIVEAYFRIAFTKGIADKGTPANINEQVRARAINALSKSVDGVVVIDSDVAEVATIALSALARANQVIEKYQLGADSGEQL